MNVLEKTVDVAAWEERRVPKDVLQVMVFVYLIREATGKGPSWSQIVKYMGWNTPRNEWKRKLGRMRRWGLNWRYGQANSTYIDKSVKEFVKIAAREAKAKD